MTLFCAHADSRSPKDYIPHASISYNHCQSSSGSQFLHLSTNPTSLPRAVSSSISDRISTARDPRGTRISSDQAEATPTKAMNAIQSTHQFADAATAQIQGLRRCVISGPTLHQITLPKLLNSVTSKLLLTMSFRSDHCQLLIRQGPLNARVAVGKEKGTLSSSGNRAVAEADPFSRSQTCRPTANYPAQDQPSIGPRSELSTKYETLCLAESTLANLPFLSGPYFFMSCSLVGENDGIPQGTLGAALAGTLVSSLHRLKDSDNNDGAFFVFGDLSVKLEGTFRLQFNLYEMRQAECYHIKCILSEPFPVHSTKNFQGMSESTFLTRSFSDQGVRLRLRKEPRTLLRKRGPAHDDYQPRHYRTSNRQGSQGAERQSVTSPGSQDAVRQGQNEQGEFVESPTGLPGYDQRPPMGRHFSQQSTGSYSGMSYDDSSKRPRTGSEQGQTPAFNQALDSPQYRGLYPDTQQSAFTSFSPQTAQAGNFSYAYSQSPHSSSLAARDQYFAQRLNTQTGAASPYDQPQRSPQYQAFPPQPQAIQYQQSPRQQGQGQGQYGMMAPSPSPRLESGLETLGIRNPVSPTGGPPTLQMAPPTYGRMTTNMPYLPSSGRRDSYQAFQTPAPNANLSAGSMAGLYARSPAVTTSGSGGLEGGY